MIYRSRAFSSVAVALALLLGGAAAEASDLVTKVTEVDQLPPPPKPGFKVPADPNQLFYLQRSTNSNTIVYAANLLKPGQLNPDHPLDVFWRRYTEDGGKRGLNFIERTMAYGATPHVAAGHPHEYDASIVSFPQINFRIGVDHDGSPEAIVQMGGRAAKIVSAYVQVDESGFIPALVYMDIYGIEKATGHILHEHLEPARS
jgi:hypothetical protein